MKAIAAGYIDKLGQADSPADYSFLDKPRVGCLPAMQSICMPWCNTFPQTSYFEWSLTFTLLLESKDTPQIELRLVLGGFSTLKCTSRLSYQPISSGHYSFCRRAFKKQEKSTAWHYYTWQCQHTPSRGLSTC